VKELKELIEISRYYGANKDYTLAGGGNTSYKNEEFIWIKASGATLSTIAEEGFAQLFRSKVQIVGVKKYSDDEQLREVEVKEDLIAANAFPEKGKRPSVETSFHELIDYSFVVHMHPTMTNALMCGLNARAETLSLFGEEAMYIPFAPGYPLFMLVKEAMVGYRKKFNQDPKIIFLENHGVFVSADSIAEIRKLYSHITDTISANVSQITAFEEIDVSDDIISALPEFSGILSENGTKCLAMNHTSLHKNFYSSEAGFSKVSLPFTPDIIVYCKAGYLYIEDSQTPQMVLDSLKRLLPVFQKKYGYPPKIILIKNHGLIAVEDTPQAAEIALEVYEDLMKVSLYSESFGGPHFLSDDEIAFIDNWEVENYRRKISKDSASESNVDQKIVISVNGREIEN
jgi:rhamnose utilization protein RhaD (predicted bifunctional aldolase and dehydrogenase)